MNRGRSKFSAFAKFSAIALATSMLVVATTSVPGLAQARGRGSGLHPGGAGNPPQMGGPVDGLQPGGPGGGSPGRRPPWHGWDHGHGDWGAAAAAGAAAGFAGGYMNGATYGSPNSYGPTNTGSSACSWLYQPNYNAAGDVSGFQRVWTCH